MSDIEGAICDECGTRIGPTGCCADARRASAINAETVVGLQRALRAAELARDAYARDSHVLRQACEYAIGELESGADPDRLADYLEAALVRAGKEPR